MLVRNTIVIANVDWLPSASSSLGAVTRFQRQLVPRSGTRTTVHTGAIFGPTYHNVAYGC